MWGRYYHITPSWRSGWGIEVTMTLRNRYSAKFWGTQLEILYIIEIWYHRFMHPKRQKTKLCGRRSAISLGIVFGFSASFKRVGLCIVILCNLLFIYLFIYSHLSFLSTGAFDIFCCHFKLYYLEWMYDRHVTLKPTPLTSLMFGT
jgi:hypothetical protein